ncbi:expressed unknown protein (Partial), partial [Seminavis robusta]|eukprot:Sro2017_g311170.1 n/a (143) ;mRNA; r:2-517
MPPALPKIPPPPLPPMMSKQKNEEVSYYKDDMDEWTTFMITTLIPPLLSPNPVTADMLSQPGDAGPKKTTTLQTGDTSFENLEKDTSCGSFPVLQWAALTFTQKVLPIDDRFVPIAEEEVQPMLDETRLAKCLPEPTVPFPDP